MIGLDAEIAREQDFLQFVQNIDDRVHVRSGKARALVNGTAFCIIGEDAFGNFLDAFFHVGHE